MAEAAALTNDERLIRPVSKHGDSANGKPAFADLPLARTLKVADELKFVNDLLAKYVAADDKVRKPFDEIKNRVAERQSETRLFLGVIGEFSSGKSTLVNALIREQLLRTDVLQGTTAAATLLVYGDQLTVDVRRRKKGIIGQAVGALVKGAKAIKGLFSKPVPPPTRDDLLKLIHEATSDEEFSKDIVQVNVGLPSATLKNGLIVVDTPGANASNPRHAQVTAAALRDVCDAALVVVPAEAAGSESLFQFLKVHAADVLFRCVFVVTKIDLIRREKERERVLQNLRSRVSQQLEIANPRVLACAPQFVIESLRSSRDSAAEESFTPDEIAGWVTHFQSMEEELDQVLRLKRLQAQVDDVAILAMQLLTHLRALLQERLDGYKNRHEALSRLVIPDIGSFINQRIEAAVSRCSDELNKIGNKSGADFHGISSSIVSDLANAISRADSRSALRTAVESTIPGIYSSGQRKLQRHLQRTADSMSKAGSAELKRFHDEFQQHFRELATLGGALGVDAVDARAIARSFSARGEAVNVSIANELKGLDQQQAFATFGATAGGAAIGTFILPGIGTLIGGVIGNVFSRMFGPSLAELKSACWSQLQPEVTAGLENCAEAADRALEDTFDSLLQELRDTIGSYLPRYQGLVQKMRERDADEKTELESFQKQIQADLVLIERRRQNLEQLRKQLRDL